MTKNTKNNVQLIRKVKPKNPPTRTRHKKKPITETKQTEDNVVGYVFIGKTQYIDLETKPRRRYLVTKQKGQNVTVSKLQSIKIFDAQGKNADKNLVEINQNYPGLTKRTGVDKWQYTKNRMSGKPLKIPDSKVFNETPEFRVSNRDLTKAQIHTDIKKYNKH